MRWLRRALAWWPFVFGRRHIDLGSDPTTPGAVDPREELTPVDLGSRRISSTQIAAQHRSKKKCMTFLGWKDPP